MSAHILYLLLRVFVLYLTHDPKMKVSFLSFAFQPHFAACGTNFFGIATALCIPRTSLIYFMCSFLLFCISPRHVAIAC